EAIAVLLLVTGRQERAARLARKRRNAPVWGLDQYLERALAGPVPGIFDSHARRLRPRRDRIEFPACRRASALDASGAHPPGVGHVRRPIGGMNGVSRRLTEHPIPDVR